MISIEYSFITGFMFGIEFVDESEFDEESTVKDLVFDLGIIRILFSWGYTE